MAGYSFSDKRVLVTGATGGLGSAVVRYLADAGARVVITARGTDALAELAASLPEDRFVAAIPADLANPDDVRHLAAAVQEGLRCVDAIFNIAGIGYFALMDEVSDDGLRHVFNVNALGPMALIKALAPRMKQQGGGRIINIASCAGRVPIPSVGVYGGSKSALAIMCNTMRLELAPYGIDVINIYPGTVDTAFEENALRESDRPGLCPRDRCGDPRFRVARKVVDAAAGAPGEVWFERQGRWMSLLALIAPSWVDRRLAKLRDRVVDGDRSQRQWRLLQVESALACNLRCVMCPWTDHQAGATGGGTMAPSVWAAIRPHLSRVRSVDFTGGGEPLLQTNLIEWVADAHAAGCETGFLTNGTLLHPDTSASLIAAGLDWIGFSMDGATAETYNAIRIGSRFERVCEHIRAFTDARCGPAPKTMINFVIMHHNVHEVAAMVDLAADLGVDQVNFKQCDVIRGDRGKGHGLFAAVDGPQVRRLQKTLAAARTAARKKGVHTTAFAFLPDEQPVCEQDPRHSMFIRYDGQAGPCINLAVGGPTTFLGEDVVMPTVHYGQLPASDLDALWESAACRRYRDRFDERVTAFEKRMADQFVGGVGGRDKVMAEARRAMPEALDGCRICHYLYDI